MNSRPKTRIGITMGDPAGIGPEVSLKYLSQSTLPSDTAMFIIGEMDVISEIAQVCGTGSEIRAAESVYDYKEGYVNVLDTGSISRGDFTPGKISGKCGRASYDYIIRGINMALAQEIHGIVTAPINKESLKQAGIDYPGHTEILADKTGTDDFSMVFKLDDLFVSHVTTHLSLREAINAVTPESVFNTINLLNTTLLNMGYSSPVIAVSGLNPHAGEHGLFGTEEIENISPAIKKANDQGINAVGPFPPDTVFMRGFRGEFHGIVSMLHDHGFVALKSRDFERGVNITVGLPIIRTSVGHGTAFDIAWQNKASIISIEQACEAALRLCKRSD